MKKAVSIFISVLLSFSVILQAPATAADEPSSKEEVIYGILGTDGSVGNIYAVNIFDGGAIKDYGIYTKVENLTTADKLYVSDDMITVNTDAKRFYYKGTLTAKELPWYTKITYKLNGKSITTDELAGQSGSLDIDISVSQNDKVNSTFFKNYALQLSVTLDTALCENIVAENATEANAGGSKQLNYTILPGKGANINITADVHDFEMKEITITGIRLRLDMDIDYSGFTSQLTQFTDAVIKLDNGAGDLLNGANQLSDGMTAYVDGLKKYKDGLSNLDSGTSQLNKGAAALNDGLKKLIDQSGVLVRGADDIQQVAFDSANAQLAAYGANLPKLTPDNYGTIISSIPQLAPLKEQLDGTVQFTQGLKEYTDGVAQLGTGASQFAGGASQLASSASTIASSANALYEAGTKLDSAVSSLKDGIAAYKDGTGEMKNGTADIAGEIKEKADNLINSMFGNSDKTVSFVSDKDTNIDSVQFVLRTAAIEKPKAASDGAVQVEKLTFWQKVLKLFGIKFD